MSLSSLRRRVVPIGLLVGVIVGSLAGAVARPPAGPPAVEARVLHAAPTLAVPGAPIELRFAAVCQPAGTPACEIADATLHVRVAGAWREIPGTVQAGEANFLVPGEMVIADGLAYYAELQPARGAPIVYPPSGAAHPIPVGTTQGFREVRLPADLSLDAVRAPDGTALFLPWGSGPGEVGLADAHAGEEALGPSSFAVGPDGGLYVADWVNRRIQVFAGASYRELSAPTETTVDLAVDDDGRIGLVGLGIGARAWTLAPDGRRLGTSPIALGAPARVAAAGGRLRVFVGPGQWVPAEGRGGRPLTTEEQDIDRTASASGALSQELGEDRLAVSWPTPSGRAGVILGLPRGIRVGVEYFVHVLDDGGVLVARGLWSDTAMAVGVFRLSASGELLDLSLLPEPTRLMDARMSTVRFRAPGEVLVAYDRADGIAIERFEVIG